MERGSVELKNVKKQISVLLPTRGRTQSLQTAVMSLIDLSEKPEDIEILVAFDEDDKESYDFFKKNTEPLISARGTSYTCFEFERLGYLRLNEYINALAAESQGRWLMFWSDDAIMETPGWDKIISDIDDFKVLRIPTHNHHPYAIFPIVPREWYQLFGYVSDHQLTDSWCSQVAYLVDIMHNVDIKVTHDRADLTGNNDDETYANRPYLEGQPEDPRDFNHKSRRIQRFEDAKKIYLYLKSQGKNCDWFENVMKGKQDPWEKMTSKEYDPNGQVARFD